MLILDTGKYETSDQCEIDMITGVILNEGARANMNFDVKYREEENYQEKERLILILASTKGDEPSWKATCISVPGQPRTLKAGVGANGEYLGVWVRTAPRTTALGGADKQLQSSENKRINTNQFTKYSIADYLVSIYAIYSSFVFVIRYRTLSAP